MLKILISHLKCFHSILLHKWFIVVVGRKLKVPWWNLLIHDLSKFLPSEFPHIARKFFGTGDDEKGFKSFYSLHIHRNRHHPAYWIDKSDIASPVPMIIVKEMLADWVSATMVYSKIKVDYNNWVWFNETFPKMNLHLMTRKRIISTLDELKYLTNRN
jgi:carbamoylphosphate synthase large subunit